MILYLIGLITFGILALYHREDIYELWDEFKIRSDLVKELLLLLIVVLWPLVLIYNILVMLFD